MGSCTRCPLHLTAKTVCVSASGSGKGKVLLVGEAPGAQEDEQGRPFVGQPGTILDSALRAAGLSRSDVILTHSVKCRPPDSRDPADAEIDACLPHLIKEIEEYEPRAIVALGNDALRSLTGKAGITRQRGRLLKLRKGLHIHQPVTATFHPAAHLHGNKLAFDNIVADLKSAARIGRGDDNFELLTFMPGTDPDVALDAIESIASSPQVAIDLEWTASEQNRADEKVKIRYPWTRDAELYSIAVGGWREDGSILSIGLPWPLPGEVREAIVGLLSDRPVVFHNAMGDLIWLLSEGITPRLAADTMILTYLIDETQPRSLDAVATRYAGMPLGWKREVQALFTERPRSEEEWRRLLYYNAEDTYATLRSFKALIGYIKASDRRDAIARLHSRLLMPALPVLARAALEGVGVDREMLGDEARKSIIRRDKALDELSAISGLPPARMMKAVGASKQTLSFLRGLGIELGSSKRQELATVKSHPAVQSIIAVRKELKYQSSYFVPWERLLDRMPDGRLHSVYRPTGTRSVRLSSELEEGGPLMVAPRNDKNVKFRQLLIARPGYRIAAPDFSQLEMRVAAWVFPEPTMAQLIRDGVDLHIRTAIDVAKPLAFKTAASVLGREPVSWTEVVDTLKPLSVLRQDGDPLLLERFGADWKEPRQNAKGVNFGYLFGMGEETFISYALTTYDLIFTPEEAKASRDAFMALYSNLPKVHAKLLREARNRGYGETIFGFRRHFDDPNEVFAAINLPVQMAAHALTLIALGACQQLITREGIDAVVIGEMHDSILFEVAEKDVDRLKRNAVPLMENPDLRPWGLSLPVPLKVDWKDNERWG